MKITPVGGVPRSALDAENPLGRIQIRHLEVPSSIDEHEFRYYVGTGPSRATAGEDIVP